MRNDPIPTDLLVIPQGSTWEASWYADDATTGGPMDWTGCYARMQIRSDFGAPTPIATLRSTTGEIVFGTDGNITATLTSAQTTALVPIKRAYFDIEVVTPDSKPWRIVQGTVAITPEVTTDA